MYGGWWYFYYTISGEKIYIKVTRKSSKIKGFRHLTNAYYIASEGEKGHWDIAVLELGINVLDWEEEKILSRVENTIRQIAGRNADKKVLVISPFYYCGDDFEENGYADRWRRIICQVVKELNYENVTYINGLEVLGDMSYMSADEIHPNIYGVQKIADSMTARIKELC